MDDFRFPPGCRAIIDVTKPPYNVDNTGKTDCTKQLCRIIDDILGAYENNFYETKAKLEALGDPDALISFEIRKIEGKSNVIFPENLPDSKIIYFPNGTYLVSDTVSYSKEEFRNFLGGLRHLEMNCQLRFMGQSRDGVTIKLRDNCKGFEFGTDRPVICFMQGEASNIAMTNMFENITVDIGSGNPGATGIRYFANNTGAVRNVKIISSDPDFRGNTGFSVLHEKVSACYVKNLEVIGFNYGIKVTPQFLYTTFEHITLSRQRRAGFFIGDTVVSIRDLKSDNNVSALKINGFCAFVVLTDAVLKSGNPLDTAIRYTFGQCMLRNISAEGYESIINDSFAYTKPGLVKDLLDEYCSHGPRMLFDDENRKSLNLKVLETPEIPWEDPEEWVSVNDYGAVGDGITDDTAAIQGAMNSGRSTVYFQPGRYLVNDLIEVPASVCRINFMYGDLAAGDRLRGMKRTGVFQINEDSVHPLMIEDLFVWEKFYGFMSLIEHGCKRTLVVSDVHVQTASIYFNTVPGGKVFMENVGCTIGGVPGAGARTSKLAGEERFLYSREVPCFYFKDQQVFCRQLNPERSLHEVINDGGLLWVMGCKTEEEGTAFETRNHGHTEIMGGVFAIGLNKEYPVILNDNSNVSVFGSTCGMNIHQQWPVAVREVRGGEIREFRKDDMPVRYMESYTIPLYIGRSGSK